MPLQNRVTPFGDIVAIRQRGLFTGNRGIIHDPATRTLTRQRWASKAWLVCSCDYKGVRREVMKHRSWTELFFLDEATALAAGHRPCFACRRVAAEQFRTAWAIGNGIDRPRARDMDRILHAERLMGRHKQLHLIPASPHDLPDGTMLASRQSSYLIAHGRFFRWNADGYEPIADVPNWDGVLTPPSTVRALQAGYKPILSPSAG